MRFPIHASTGVLRGWLAAGLAASVLSACANLKEVQQFAATSAEGASFQRILDDYQSAPVRQGRYVVPDDHTADDARTLLQRNADERKLQVVRAKVLLSAVSDYMEAVGALAGDEVASADTELGGLIDASVDGKWLPQEKADAAKSLVDLVADAALERYRQKQLRRIIQRGNQPLQSVLEHMQTLNAAFVVSESAAHEQMDTYYKYLERSAMRTEPVAVLLLKARHGEDDAAESDRLERLSIWSQTLKDIARGHQHLFDNLQHLDQQAVRATVVDYAKRIAKLVEQLKQST